MADVLLPLPPTNAGTSVAVPNVAVPPINAPVAPVSVTPVFDAVKTITPKQRIEDAATNRDDVSLWSFSQTYKNTPEGEASARLAKQISDGKAKYAETLAGIDPNTPEGRLKAMQTYKTVKDNPQMGDALMMYIGGDKKSAIDMLTGGRVESKTEYLPTTGRMVSKRINALGEVVSVTDVETGAVIPKTEYARLGGSVSALENTMYWKSRQESQKFNTEKFNQANEAHNEIASKSRAKGPLVDEYLGLMTQFLNNPDIKKEDRAAIAGVASSQINFAQTVSNSRQILDQFGRTSADKLSTDQRKAFEAGLAGPVGEAAGTGPLRIGVNGQISDSAGNNYSVQQLKNLMDTSSVGKQLDRSFAQQQKNLQEQVTIGRLTNEQYIKLQRALDLNNQIQKMNLETEAKFGNPSFTIPTTGAQMMDQSHRPLAQALQEKFNIEVVQAFNDWKIDQMRKHKEIDRSYVPEPGELEAVFTKTDFYKGKQKEYSKKMVEVINTPYIEQKTSALPSGIGTVGAAQQNAMSGGVAPAVSPSSEGQAQEAARLKQKALDAARKKYVK
jgi:predicted nuclease of restriction endonuclease-like (RecB) superfamily